jgi:hypothetical protein
MSEMRVNYDKSEIVSINLEQVKEVESFSDVFGCPVGSFPITYLGITLHHNNLGEKIYIH